MTFTNHVILQGYLEILKAEMLRLNGNDSEVPVIHARLQTGGFLSSHRLLITNSAGEYLLEILRQMQEARGKPVAQIRIDLVNGLLRLDDRPLVVVEGQLLSRPGQESVVNVKWITLVSSVFGRDEDLRLREIVSRWNELTPEQKERIYRHVSSK